MSTARRSVIWPMIIVGIGGVWLLNLSGELPEAVGDILVRAWPALLIFFGFDVLVGGRRVRVARWRVELSVIGLIFTLLFVAGIVGLAYWKQGDVERADNIKTFAEVLGPEIRQVRVEVTLKRTRLEVVPSPEDERAIQAEFKGSRESSVVMEWAVEGQTAVLTITETYRSALPRLEDYGRGTLEIELPAAVIVEQLELRNSQGDVAVDLLPLRVQQFDAVIAQGDLSLNLPAFDTIQARLKINNGALDLLVPQEVALVLSLAQGGGDPRYQYDSFRYDLLRDGTLKRKNTEAFQAGLTVWLKDGARLAVVDVEQPVER